MITCQHKDFFWTKMKINIVFKKWLQLAVLVQPLVLCIELLNVHFLSVFSEVYISVVHFLDNSYLHIWDSVAWLVGMISCCFVEVFVGYIALMFSESGLNRAVRFSNILLCTFRARNTIDCILCLAINWLVDCHYCLTGCSSDLLSLQNKWTDWTPVAFLHAW